MRLGDGQPECVLTFGLGLPPRRVYPAAMDMMTGTPLSWSSMVAPAQGLLLAVGWWGAVRLARTMLVPAIRHWAGRTENGFDDAVAHALGALRWVWCLPAALLVALQGALADGLLLDALHSAAWIAAALQVALVASAFIDHAIRHARDRRGADGRGSTGLAALSVIARAGLWILLGILLLDNLGVDVGTLLAGLGVGGIAIGLAVQRVLGDLFAYFAILFDKPFETGHFVVIDGMSGTVEHIGIKTTRIRSLDGEIIVFGNADLTQSRVRNFRLMRERRVAFRFGIEYATPADQVAAVPGMVRESVAALEGVRFDRAHFVAFGESSLDFEVVYWVASSDYGVFMDLQQEINLALLRRFEAAGIGFAFPTRTLHLHPAPSSKAPE
jgi:small-conductance mechanosensitive channel